MKFFSTDSPLYRFILRFWDVVKISLLWLLCSIPVVTVGPATAALAAIGLQMADETEGYVARDFLKAFKANLKKGIPLGLLLLVAMEAVYLDFQFFQLSENGSMLFLIAGIIACFVFVMAFIYAFPLQARYENTVMKTIRNSYDIATRYFLRTLFLVLLVAFEMVIFMWNTTLMFIGILIGPGTIMFTICSFALRFFREIEKEPGALSGASEEN
jgi:uncharacterized membrane protein YesL